MENILGNYRGKDVLVMGGLGFIGSNVVKKLVDFGAKVTIMDCQLEHHGANYFNVDSIEDKINIDLSDIRDKGAVLKNVKDKAIIFDFAAYIDPSQSRQDITSESGVNNLGHLNILESCREINPSCKIIFPSSRMVYGQVEPGDLPIKESQKLNPLSLYTSNKIAVENYFKIYRENHGLDTLVLRISNPFGPGAQIKNPGYCITNWFIRQALEDKPITLFGEGDQLRDYIFVEDVADAFVTAGVSDNLKSKIFNIGSGVGIPFKEMAEKIVLLSGRGSIRQIPWPKNYKSTETGDFYADIDRAKQELGWIPKTEFEEGLRKTIDFYSKNLDKYI